MRLFKPNLSLAAIYRPGEPDKFVLHSVTYFDSTDFEADGHEILSSNINKNGEFEVNLKVRRNENKPNVHYITPITHTIMIDSFEFSDSDTSIRVTIVDDSNTKIGEGVVSSVDADEDSRPIYDPF